MPELESIRPREHFRVIDLVKRSGLDVSDWSNFAGGTERAATNPKYCYEWAFVQPERAVVLNLWYEELRDESGEISTSFTLRNRDDLKGPRRARAEKLLDAIHLAASGRIPLRVIVNSGSRTSIDETSNDRSRVDKRLLDPMPWRVDTCDFASGSCSLKRGAPSGAFVDQFSVSDVAESDAVERRSVLGERFVRDASLRARVLTRADGRCEHCDVLGFVMPNGRVYLETHHVVPLSENGPDALENMIALCPNDHREAHHGARASEMRTAMLTTLRRLLGAR